MRSADCKASWNRFCSVRPRAAGPPAKSVLTHRCDNRSRWSLDFTRKVTVLTVSSIEGNYLQHARFPVRICYICNEYPPGLHGGIGSVTQTLARSLVHAGHTVRVVGLYSCGETRTSPEWDEGVEVWRLPEPRWPGGWIAARTRLFRLVRRWCREGAVDIVEVPDYQGLAAGWLQLPVPVVVRSHGSGCFFAALADTAPRRLTAMVERASLRRADFWCAVSRFAADVSQRVFRLSGPADAIIYNAVECHAESAGPRSSGDVVFTGTLAVKKGVVPLIRAWPAVVARCPDAKLHLYGKDVQTDTGRSMRGHLEASLEATVRPSVTFHGHVSRGRVLEALSSARAAIFPSYAESFGLAPVEAMSCGCPTIYSRRPPGPEIVQEDVDGLLVDPDDVEEIAQAIVRLLTDDRLAERLGSVGRCRVRERFSLDATRAANEAFYQGCMESFNAPIRRRDRVRRPLDATAEAGALSK